MGDTRTDGGPDLLLKAIVIGGVVVGFVLTIYMLITFVVTQWAAILGVGLLACWAASSFGGGGGYGAAPPYAPPNQDPIVHSPHGPEPQTVARAHGHI